MVYLRVTTHIHPFTKQSKHKFPIDENRNETRMRIHDIRIKMDWTVCTQTHTSTGTPNVHQQNVHNNNVKMWGYVHHIFLIFLEISNIFPISHIEMQGLYISSIANERKHQHFFNSFGISMIISKRNATVNTLRKQNKTELCLCWCSLLLQLHAILTTITQHEEIYDAWTTIVLVIYNCYTLSVIQMLVDDLGLYLNRPVILNVYWTKLCEFQLHL